jgi:hypothetical protein
MGNVSQDTWSRHLLHPERGLSFSEQMPVHREQNAQRWMRNFLRGLAAHLAKFAVMAAAIVTLASVVATPGWGKEYSRHPAIYEPSPPPAYEPAYPTVYEPAPPKTHRPTHDGYQTIGYDYSQTQYYLRDYLYFFWHWFWCNIVFILIIVIIFWFIIHSYYRARINQEFANVIAIVGAVGPPPPAAPALFAALRNRLPV